MFSLDLEQNTRKYDRILTLVHFDQQFLTVGFLKDNGLAMYDLTKNTPYWQIPKTPSEIPLCATSSPDGEKLLIAYSSNKIRIFDIMNKCLHPWSRKNDELFPQNFLSRYNRLIGATSLSNTKFLFYSNYTYSILDLTKDLPVNPPEVKII